MQTFNQVLTERLQENGMFESQAIQVMQNYRASELAASGDLTNKSVDGYPDIIVALVWAGVRFEALKYCSEHCPEAWFKPLFDDNDPIHTQFAQANKETS